MPTELARELALSEAAEKVDREKQRQTLVAMTQRTSEAMISRIHLALKYDALGRNARKAIWSSFLEDGTCADLLDELARKELNGREVRFRPTADRSTKS